MNFLLLFFTLSIVNVIFSTVRSILTIKGGKITASLLSGGYFAFYNVMLIYTVAEFPMWQKCLITFVCNVLGVFIVKLIEEKMRKDRLWEIKGTIPNTDEAFNLIRSLKNAKVPCNYIDINKYLIIQCYASTQEESAIVKRLFKENDVKYFASESKIL